MRGHKFDAVRERITLYDVDKLSVFALIRVTPQTSFMTKKLYSQGANTVGFALMEGMSPEALFSSVYLDPETNPLGVSKPSKQKVTVFGNWSQTDVPESGIETSRPSLEW